MTEIAIIAGVLFVYGLVSRALLKVDVSAPMVFVAAGILFGASVLGLAEMNPVSEVSLVVAEIALVVVLFADASRSNLSGLREDGVLAGRLLAIGMPLTIAVGTAAAAVLLIGVDFWEGAVVAAILAPTDAALGHPVVTSKLVPAKIRETINIEAGLNDGLSIPFLLVFLGLAVDQTSVNPTDSAAFAIQQIGLGALAGIVLGGGGGWLVAKAIGRGAMTWTFERLAMVGLAIGAWAAASAIDGNGFIAAFVAGLAVAKFQPSFGGPILDFAEREGQLLSLVVFFVFGTAAIGYLEPVDFGIVVFALLTLTLVRMGPVAIALTGSGLSRASVSFIGWFGPRGLASIILLLVVIAEEPNLPALDVAIAATTVTVLLSVFLHGVSAGPLSILYGRKVKELPPDAPEFGRAGDTPIRRQG
ncbi:MAG: cation:proton antiporter [Solirubrobacterales bacterium]